MLKQLIAGAFLLAVTGPGAVGQDIAAAPSGLLDVPVQQAPEIVREFLFGTADIDAIAERKALLADIAAWLAANFELPRVEDQPYLTRVPPARLTALRQHGLLPAQGAGTNGPQPPSPGQRATVALYIDGERTIYLPLGWSGRTPAELSMLVHEMVHHLQARSGEKYECPQARETLAYAAQQRWLGQFGTDLQREFEINPFTVLVSSMCGN